ncbi:hypothetical protein [Caulobacter sp. UNC279MFTsu5.1]|uniref:hypothetical protein n=1 Tax=Caulobacter sp. UNC279MFTsu5.1 TaxID=1502775 RepID=UPI0008EF919B|nr:hypothetical protein [Caulobacter sp. UNC279MFTsu5.1]SFK46729.1 hypothetical protein SAMN02799626_04372 [Caulobacter sp. UNC279MFTsu5.1]
MIRPSPVARRAVLAASLALLASPAFARSAKKEKKGAKEGEGEEAADPVIKLQSMALPIIAGGKLVNYVFVQMTLTLKPGVLVTIFEGKEPLLRDAIVREAHDRPFLRPDSYVALDEARLKASVLREVNGLIGPGKVALVTVVKQTPRNFVAPPAKPGTQAKPAPRPAPAGDSDLVP